MLTADRMVGLAFPFTLVLVVKVYSGSFSLKGIHFSFKLGLRNLLREKKEEKIKKVALLVDKHPVKTNPLRV